MMRVRSLILILACLGVFAPLPRAEASLAHLVKYDKAIDLPQEMRTVCDVAYESFRSALLQLGAESGSQAEAARRAGELQSVIIGRTNTRLGTAFDPDSFRAFLLDRGFYLHVSIFPTTEGTFIPVVEIYELTPVMDITLDEFANGHYIRAGGVSFPAFDARKVIHFETPGIVVGTRIRQPSAAVFFRDEGQKVLDQVYRHDTTLTTLRETTIANEAGHVIFDAIVQRTNGPLVVDGERYNMGQFSEFFSDVTEMHAGRGTTRLYTFMRLVAPANIQQYKLTRKMFRKALDDVFHPDQLREVEAMSRAYNVSALRKYRIYVDEVAERFERSFYKLAYGLGLIKADYARNGVF